MRLAEDGTPGTPCFDSKFSGSPVSVSLSASPSVPASSKPDRGLDSTGIVSTSVPSVDTNIDVAACLQAESKPDSAFGNATTDSSNKEIVPVSARNSKSKSVGIPLSASGRIVKKIASQVSARKPPCPSAASAAPRRKPMATVVMLNTLGSATDAAKPRPSLEPAVVQLPSDPHVSKDIEPNSALQHQTTQANLSPTTGQKLPNSSAHLISGDASSDGGGPSVSCPIASGERNQVRPKSVARCCAIPKHLLPTWLPPSMLDPSIDPEADDDDLIDIQRYLRVKTPEEMAAPLIIGRTRPTSSTGRGRGAHRGANSVTARARRADTRRANAEAQARNNRTHQAVPQRQQPIRSNARTRKRNRAAAQMESSTQENGRNRNYEVGSGAGAFREESASPGERRLRDDTMTGSSGRLYEHMTEPTVSLAPAAPPTKRSRSSAAPSYSAATGTSGGTSGGQATNGRSTVPREKFTKHESKKGWLVCKICKSNVWPPNCNKHEANCKKK